MHTIDQCMHGAHIYHIYRAYLSQPKSVYILGPKGPCYGSGKRKEKKKNLPSLAPGAPFIGGQCGSKMAHILVATSYIGAHQTSVVRTH